MERIHSLFLSFRLEDPSCAFGAALLQGPTHGAEFTLFSFHSASRIHPAPLARPFSKGLLMERSSLSFPFIPPWRNPSCAFGAALLLGPTHEADSLSFPFIPPWGSILRLWRAPSSRGYSISKTPFFHLNPSHQSLVTSHKKEKSQLSLTLFRDRVSSREADIGHCFFLPPR